MTIVETIETTLIERGFERIIAPRLLSDATALLYEVRQYQRHPFPNHKEILPLVETKSGRTIPGGPVCENVTVHYPKPQYSAKEIIIHYQTCFGCFEFNKYGYFDMNCNPLGERTPDKENKNRAKEIQEALFI